MAKTTPMPMIRSVGRDLPAIIDEVTALAPDRVLVGPARVAAAARAWSENSVRAFLFDLRLWDGRCRQAGTKPRAASGTVANYVRALSGELVDGCPSLKPRAAATIGLCRAVTKQATGTPAWC